MIAVVEAFDGRNFVCPINALDLTVDGEVWSVNVQYQGKRRPVRMNGSGTAPFQPALPCFPPASIHRRLVR